jgi:hypothetical protein
MEAYEDDPEVGICAGDDPKKQQGSALTLRRTEEHHPFETEQQCSDTPNNQIA